VASTHVGEGWLRLLRKAARVDYLCIVEYARERSEGGAATPRLVEGCASPGMPNVTAKCFATYRQRFWREDEATRLAQHGTGQGITVLHFSATDIKEPSWRHEIYDSVDLEARLSFLYQPVAGTTTALNLYRRCQEGPFSADELDQLLRLAPLIQLAHRTVLRTRQPGSAPALRIENAERVLRIRVPELSAREAQVCARISCGLSLDGIADDLDVAPSSAATLRKRAYAKLSRRGWIHGRDQLVKLAQ
jgi:DNA-binding CsgD family transcriptional regulator